MATDKKNGNTGTNGDDDGLEAEGANINIPVEAFFSLIKTNYTLAVTVARINEIQKDLAELKAIVKAGSAPASPSDQIAAARQAGPPQGPRPVQTTVTPPRAAG